MMVPSLEEVGKGKKEEEEEEEEEEQVFEYDYETMKSTSETVNASPANMLEFQYPQNAVLALKKKNTPFFYLTSTH